MSPSIYRLWRSTRAISPGVSLLCWMRSSLSRERPWTVEDLGSGEYDHHRAWASASHMGVELLGKLAAAGADFGENRDRAWEVITHAVRDRGEAPVFAEDQEVRPLDHAVNRGSMRSLSVAFVFAESTSNPDTEPQQLLDLLDETLTFRSPRRTARPCDARASFAVADGASPPTGPPPTGSASSAMRHPRDSDLTHSISTLSGAPRTRGSSSSSGSGTRPQCRGCPSTLVGTS